MELEQHHPHCGIRSDFLSPQNYKATLEFAEKRYENYLRFCKLIERYYGDLQAMSRVVSEKLKTPSANGLQTINQFKKFILDFMSIIEEVSTFKISFYAELKDVEEDPVKKPTYELLANVNKYAERQTQYKELNEKLRKVEDNIQNSYIQLKKETKDPVVYFDHKYTRTKCTQIEESIKNREELQKEGNILLETIYNNTDEFEREIMFYRQKMLSGKYKIYKKLGEMAKGARECLVETLLSLLESVNDKVNAFKKLQRQSQRQSTLLEKFKNRSKNSINTSQNGGDLNTIQIIIQATQQYNALINDLEAVLRLLTESFSLVGLNTKEFQDSSKLIVEELNKLYQNDENPTPDIIETLQLFNYFCNKLSDIPNRIHIHQANLAKLRQNITKHSEITLSIVRCGGSKLRGQNKGLDQISHLFEQLSYDYLNDIIQKIYKEYQDSLGNIKNHFNAKFYKKRKNMVEDSMDISHVEQETPFLPKKPSKKQQWIWKDFRNLQKYHQLSDYSAMKQEISKFLKCFTDMKNEEEKQIQKYSCNLKQKKEVKGTLRILQKCLEFTSSNNQINIKIPYDYIEQVIAGVNIFQKQLNVKTSIDNVTFLHFPEISRAEVLIQQQIATQSSNKKVDKKLSVEVTDQQKKFIAERRQKIEGERQTIEGMQEMGSALLQNTTVDAVYDVIYSDKPFKNRGKQQPCFMGYTLKKGGGSNYTTTPYTPAGPKFYSLQEGSTFINTPLFSERTNTYEVPLPPIPFMPKFCSNIQKIKLFWISNEEFDYVIRSNSSGAPGADSFYIAFVHRIVQKDKNVEIKIYFKITFVKDTSLKGMITSKSEQQSKENVQILLKQAKRVMKSVGGAANSQEGKTQNQQKQQEQESMSKSQGSGKVKKLQNQNKILIGVLVGVILLNLILRFF